MENTCASNENKNYCNISNSNSGLRISIEVGNDTDSITIALNPKTARHIANLILQQAEVVDKNQLDYAHIVELPDPLSVQNQAKLIQYMIGDLGKVEAMPVLRKRAFKILKDTERMLSLMNLEH